jgi:oxygen-independent coproporphyrinogen-3 oxidase
VLYHGCQQYPAGLRRKRHRGYVQNEVHIPAYSESIASGRLATVKGYALTDDDRLRAEIIERIMCDFGVDLYQVCARHGSIPETVLKSSPRLHDFRRRRRT